MRVFRSLHTYQPGTFEGWLHRITTNVFLDKMRRKQRIRFDALSDESPPGCRAAARARAGLPRRPLRRRRPARARRPLPDFRAAVVLCDIEGLSYEEVAATLGIKLGTVRSRIHRGRAQLRESLAHRAPSRATPAQPRPGVASSADPPRDRMTDAMRVRCLGDEMTEYAAGRLPLDRPVGVGPPPRRLPRLRPRRRPGAAPAQRLAGAPSMPGDLRSSLLGARHRPGHRCPGRASRTLDRRCALLAPSAPRATAAPCGRPSSPRRPPGSPPPPRGASPSSAPRPVPPGPRHDDTPAVAPARATTRAARGTVAASAVDASRPSS